MKRRNQKPHTDEGPNPQQGKAPACPDSVTKPKGGAESRRETGPADPQSDLLEQVFAQENLSKAWKQVKANGGAPGIDGITIEQFPDWFRPQWPTLRTALLEGSYQPAPVRRTQIDKPDGGKRMLGIPRLLDRLIQQAIAQVLGPIFEPTFSDHSYGFRPRRSAHQAIERLRQSRIQGYRLAVDLDLSKFFDRVNHDLLMQRVGRQVRWTEKAFQAFKREIRQLTGRSWGVSMAYRMKKLSEYIRGWMGYFGISEYYRPIPALDEWLRRRVRMCYWKQWRKPRTRIRNLIKLGTYEKTAIQTGLSRKSYWRLSRTLATQSGMTNRWLKEQGLVSIRDQWIAIHYPATAR